MVKHPIITPSVVTALWVSPFPWSEGVRLLWRRSMDKGDLAYPHTLLPLPSLTSEDRPLFTISDCERFVNTSKLLNFRRFADRLSICITTGEGLKLTTL